MSTPGSIGSAPSAIERLVDEAVGLGVLLAADVADRPAARSRAGPASPRAWSSRMLGVLDLVLALRPGVTISSESPTSSSSVGAAAPRARSIPSSSARYSATLLVASPIRSPPSSSTAPSVVAGRRADRRRPGVAAGAAVDVDDHLRQGSADRLAGAGGRRGASLAALAAPAFHWRAERSSCSISVPLVDLEDRPQLVAEVDAPLVPAELPGDRDPDLARRPGRGADRDRWLAQGAHQAGDGARRLAAVEAGDRALEAAGGDSETSGAGRRPTFAPAAAGSTQPSRRARSRQRSQTSCGPSFGLMKVRVRSPARIVRRQTAQAASRSPLQS